MSSRSVQPNQKSEIFHYYNGPGASETEAGGLMTKNNGHFGDHLGSEKSQSRNSVLESKLQLYDPLGVETDAEVGF